MWGDTLLAEAGVKRPDILFASGLSPITIRNGGAFITEQWEGADPCEQPDAPAWFAGTPESLQVDCQGQTLPWQFT